MAKLPSLADLNGKQLQELINKANELAAERQQETIANLRAQFQELAEAEGLTIADIIGTPKKQSRKGGAVVVKYRHPKDPSLTWSGRGRPAKWLSELMEQGHDKEKYAVK